MEVVYDVQHEICYRRRRDSCYTVFIDNANADCGALQSYVTHRMMMIMMEQVAFVSHSSGCEHNASKKKELLLLLQR